MYLHNFLIFITNKSKLKKYFQFFLNIVKYNNVFIYSTGHNTNYIYIYIYNI